MFKKKKLNIYMYLIQQHQKQFTTTQCLSWYFRGKKIGRGEEKQRGGRARARIKSQKTHSSHSAAAHASNVLLALKLVKLVRNP